MSKSEYSREKRIKLEAQPISESDLATILSLHLRRLGWSYVLETTIADRQIGFPCEKEEFCIRRQLKNTVWKISEWFKTMGRVYNWPSVAGWIWEIEFESSQAIPKKVAAEANKADAEANGVSNAVLVEGPLMTLSDMDLDIIKRLLEKREALADQIRSSLRLFLDNKLDLNEINSIVRQLGAADKDVRDWFLEMAKIYKWPKIESNSWLYRVEIEDKQVYLVHR